MTAKQFWTYFLECEQEFREGCASPETVREFENMLHSIVKVDWEIGPTDDGRTRLSFSPDSDNPRQVARANKLIAQAPAIERWEVSLYKPARKWRMLFQMLVGDKEIKISGSKWEFVLYAFEDNTFDIVFKPPRAEWKAAGTALQEAAIILVDGELGERVRRERIGEIEVVEEWDDAQKESSQDLAVGLLASLILRG